MVTILPISRGAGWKQLILADNEGELDDHYLSHFALGFALQTLLLPHSLHI